MGVRRNYDLVYKTPYIMNREEYLCETQIIFLPLNIIYIVYYIYIC